MTPEQPPSKKDPIQGAEPAAPPEATPSQSSTDASKSSAAPPSKAGKAARAKTRWDLPLLDSVAIPPWAQQWLVRLLCAYALVCAALFLAEPKILFHPMPRDPGAQPALRSGAANYFRTPAAPALPWEASICEPGPGKARLAIAYFGGNFERASAFGALARDKLPGCEAYALDYPGYEGAPGSSSEGSVMEAARDMMAAMAKDGWRPEQVVLVGRSLGSGVAARLAAELPACARAALLTPYESLAKVAADTYFWTPVNILVRDKFDTADYAPKARCGATIVFADHDDVIAPHHAMALSKTWNPDMGMSLSSNSHATHSNIVDLDSTWSTLAKDLRGQAASLPNQAPGQGQEPGPSPGPVSGHP